MPQQNLFLKSITLLGIMVALCVVLMSISGLSSERQQRQSEAAQSVADSLASSQTLLGPLLMRTCRETWLEPDSTDAKRPPRTASSETTLLATPTVLELNGAVDQEARYRGIFKVNAYVGRLKGTARWEHLQALKFSPEHPNGQVQCAPLMAMLAATDARGLRGVSLTLEGRPLTLEPGTLHASYPKGLHAELPGLDLNAALALDLNLELVGTERLDLVPAAGSTQVKLRSNWPHPSFDGRFLPVERNVGPEGFEARWQVSALATTAIADVTENHRVPGLGGTGRVTDTLGFALLDPVNPYVMSDRAIKYGLLFIVLTFVSVGLVEVLGQRRVHPVQYLLVGLALSVFYLLLLSLSEHLGFEMAYAIAATGAAALLTHYAAAMLGTWKRGGAFGAGIAGLYGVLYVLLSREQTALAIGAVLLFAVLAVVMTLTRRLDWYGLGVKGS